MVDLVAGIPSPLARAFVCSLRALRKESTAGQANKQREKTVGNRIIQFFFYRSLGPLRNIL